MKSNDSVLTRGIKENREINEFNADKPKVFYDKDIINNEGNLI